MRSFIDQLALTARNRVSIVRVDVCLLNFTEIMYSICVKQHCKRQHSSNASRAVSKAHEKDGGQKRDSRRLDGTLHKPRQNGNKWQQLDVCTQHCVSRASQLRTVFDVCTHISASKMTPIQVELNCCTSVIIFLVKLREKQNEVYFSGTPN